MNIDMLDTRGFVTVQYPPLLRRRVLDAMESWKNFCSLPFNEKKKLSGGDRLHDFGYMRRNDSGPRADNKEQFHLLRCLLEELYARAVEIPDTKATVFIKAIDVLLQASFPLVCEFAREVERRYGLTGFEQEVAESCDDWTFRYLHYFGGKDILAHPHTDRGGFTFHLHESHEGGEYYGFDERWHPWPISDGETIIFPSMGLQYRSSGKLKALCHRVVANPLTVEEGRFAMVVFIDFKQNVRYNDAARRLQEFEPGFNYRMPMEEFSNLFIPR